MPLKEKNMISMSDPRVSQFGHPAPAWLVNYADLMTELVCFFVILYALSASLSKDVQQAKKDVEETMKQEQVAGDVKVTKEGMVIMIQETGENVFFGSGSADISPTMTEILAKLSPILKRMATSGHDIVVEGHTDNIPIHNAKFSSNWELSTARATRVVQHLIRAEGLPAPHMAAIGYGEHHPLAANDSEEGRAKNRRVVFFVKNKPADFSKGEQKKKDEPTEEAAPVAEAALAEEEATPSEPTVDSALPLPAEAPGE